MKIDKRGEVTGSGADRPARPASRREALLFLAGAGLVPMLGCSMGGAPSSPDGATPGDGGTPPDGATSSDWASGGTAAMTAKASYPDPFTGALTSCALVASTTEGPCTTASDLSRADVSEGLPGVPVRLALKVVDTSCGLLAGATVKIWHTNIEGSYSGQTPNNNMCLKQQSYSTANFFRGVQTTGGDGTVFFDTCFPGWYRGRAVHIHFQVKNGNTSYRISQLFFPEDVTSGIFAGHADYRGHGQPDTVFSNDNIMAAIPSAQRDRHVLTVSRMSDGAMLASKAVTVS
jgi:protocatechuate 3,4-dioxygenase beta subunit